MINLKQLFSTALVVSCISSLNAHSHVCTINPRSLTMSGGVHMLHPISSKSKIWGIGGEFSLYSCRANRLGIHIVGQVAYMSDSDFDLGASYNAAPPLQVSTFDQENQGGLKDTAINGRISVGKEIIFPKKDSNFLQRKGRNCLCTRLYIGGGIAVETDIFRSKNGIIKTTSTRDIFNIDKLNSYSIIPGIDLRLFYGTDTVVIVPEFFVGPSIYGRGNYTINYGKFGAYVYDELVKTSQDLGVSIYLAIPLLYKMRENISVGVRLSFKGNYRDEEIKTPIETPGITRAAGKLGYGSGTKINGPLSENVGGAISIQITYINM